MLANDFSQYLKNSLFFDNLANLNKEAYHFQDILSLLKFEKAKKEISSWPNYKVTPLANLSDLARETGVNALYYKDEHHRFSLKSFKALGGAYAVANLLLKCLKEKGITATSKDLFNKKFVEFTKHVTVCCATDGNHGKSVAWGANIFGCGCEIFVHNKVSVTREQEILKYEANVRRTDCNYDETVKTAATVAKQKGYFIVSDTSYEGYVDIPKDVMQGYTIMVDEALKQMQTKPTHIFLQGGVGGLAAAVVSFVLETYKDDVADSLQIIIVEPNRANCLLQSAKNGRPTVVHGSLATIMAGLSCGEVSLLGWKILAHKVRGFLSIDDEPIGEVMRLLATSKNPVVAGESGVAGLAGYLMVQSDVKLRAALNITEDSKVLFFGTEGDTDAGIYKEMVGKTSEEVLGQQVS